MDFEKSATRQRGKTVRIVTDFPVLVQTQNTLMRKGASKPVSVLLGDYLISLSVTDSGEPVLKIRRAAIGRLPSCLGRVPVGAFAAGATLRLDVCVTR